jgi:hypothetical protein
MNYPLLFGPYGDPIAADIKSLTNYGVNAVWFHSFNPRAFEACRKHDLSPCVEFKTFRADFEARPELIPTGVDGEPIRYGKLVQGVCLSQTAFLEETEAALVDGIRAFDPTGVWFDYLTYAGWFETPDPDLQESCFCPDCIAEFCEATGVDATTPEEILARYPEVWTRHKCERVAKFARRYANIVRSQRPECVTGAYMCPWTPDAYDGALRRIFAQDYDLMAPAIDIYTPLIYAEKSGRSPEWGREFLADAVDFIPPARKVQLILDVLDFPESLLAVAESSSPSWGIQMFGGAAIFRNPERAAIFRKAVERIRQALGAEA